MPRLRFLESHALNFNQFEFSARFSSEYLHALRCRLLDETRTAMLEEAWKFYINMAGLLEKLNITTINWMSTKLHFLMELPIGFPQS